MRQRWQQQTWKIVPTIIPCPLHPTRPSPAKKEGKERRREEGGGDRGRGDRREGEKKVVGNEKLTDAKVKVLTSLIWTLIKRNSFNVDNWIKGRDETLAVVIGINLPGKHKKKVEQKTKWKEKKGNSSNILKWWKDAMKP